MFGCINQRFLCFAAAGFQAAVFQPALLAQVQVSGSATHYRSLGADLNIGDEYLNILGMGTDPTDGVTFIVCSTGTDLDCPSSDQIHIYRHNTTSNQWVFESSIDHIGFVSQELVAVDGGTVVIGRSFGQAFGNDGTDIYRRSPGGVWIHEAALLPADNFPGNQFGKSVSIDGDRVAIGAPKDDPDDATHAWEGKGSVYIYDRVGSTWSLTEKVTAGDGLQGDEFGESIAVHNTVSGWKLLVGSPDHSTDTGGINEAGALYAFMNTGSQWVQTDKVVVTTDQNAIGSFGDQGIGFDGEIIAAIDFSDMYLYEMNALGQLGSLGSQLGTGIVKNPVCVNREIIVGDPNGDLVSSSGQPNVSYIRENPAGFWVIAQFPRPAVFVDGDSYGSSVAFNGGVFLAGAPLYDGAGSNSGGIWSESIAGFTYPTGILLEGQASPFSGFGGAIDANDEWVIIGAAGSTDTCQPGTMGSVRVMRYFNNQWTVFDTINPPMSNAGQGFGSAVALDGDRMIIGMSGYTLPGQADILGAVFIYDFVGFQWTLTQTIEGGAVNDGFGGVVDLEGDHLAIGMPDSPASGAVKLYHRDSSGIYQSILTTGAGNATQDARFGHAVSLFGDNLLVSAPTNQSYTGRVLAFHYDHASSTWAFDPELTLANIAEDFVFGISIAQTEDHALIGYFGSVGEPGHIAVFPRTAQGYGQPTIIDAPAGAIDNRFGASLAVKGNKLLVGHADPFATQAHFMAFNGNTYQLIQTMTVPSGDNNARFGSSLAIGSETLFVGASGESTSQVHLAGAVHLYESEIRYTVPECDMAMESDRIQWIQDDVPNQSELFAYSIEVDNGYAIAGEPYEDHSFIHQGTTINGDNAGKATIYERTGLREWSEVAIFRGGNFDDPIGISHQDWLGWSVDIEGDTAVAGGIQGRFENNPLPSGSVRVYERGPGGWYETPELFPPELAIPGSAQIREFGESVDLDSTANFLAVGATNASVGATGTGAGYVFERSTGGWTSSGALLPPTVLFADHIGTSCSVEEGWAAFGATDVDTFGSNSGAVHFFKRAGTGAWIFHSTIDSPAGVSGSNFGKSLEISRSDLGLTLVVGAFNEREGFVSSAGAGYVFVLDETADQWNQIQRLLPEFVVTSAQYGTDISIDHNTIAVGGPSMRDSDTFPSVWTGGAEVYNLDIQTGQFVRRTTIRPDVGQWNTNNHWGSSIGLSGGTVFIGSSTADGEMYDPANMNLNYGAMIAYDIICLPDCSADINGDGVLDFFDISGFLIAFSLMDPAADFNGDGSWDFFDISLFLTTFSSGC